MDNLFFTPFKNMTTQQRIDRALERLRQRYGVPSGFVSEPEVAEVRNGPKVTHTLSSLKSFNEDLITLEVFAYGHNQVEKLSGQLLLNTANRLPANPKRRYLDELDKSLLDLNQPSSEGFELLRKFVAHEIKLMTSDYAQALFKTEEKDKSRECKYTVRVRPAAVSTASKPNNVSNRQGLNQFDAGVRSQRSPSKSAVLPECFVCSNKHYLADCDKFKVLPTNLKRQTVFGAKRCLNCLSLNHMVRNCAYPSKCKCRPDCRTKHATALHDYYVKPDDETFGAAEAASSAPTSGSASANDYDVIVNRKIDSVDKRSRMDICSNLINSRRAVVNVCKCDARECDNLRLENTCLKENLRKIELKDEELLPLREDDMARSLVEPNIKVINGRFEMPVPLKAELIETLPHNYELALKRTLSLRTSALKNPVLKQTLIDTFF